MSVIVTTGIHEDNGSSEEARGRERRVEVDRNENYFDRSSVAGFRRKPGDWHLGGGAMVVRRRAFGVRVGESTYHRRFRTGQYTEKMHGCRIHG